MLSQSHTAVTFCTSCHDWKLRKLQKKTRKWWPKDGTWMILMDSDGSFAFVMVQGNLCVAGKAIKVRRVWLSFVKVRAKTLNYIKLLAVCRGLSNLPSYLCTRKNENFKVVDRWREKRLISPWTVTKLDFHHASRPYVLLTWYDMTCQLGKVRCEILPYLQVWVLMVTTKNIRWSPFVGKWIKYS